MQHFLEHFIILLLTRLSIKDMPKTKEQFEKIRLERIQTILRSALELFALKGYDAVGLDEVTKHANCSHGLLYHYYSGKEELYRAVVEELVYPTIREIANKLDYNQKAKYVVHDMIDFLLKLLKSPSDENAMKVYLFLNIHLQKSMKFIRKNEEGHTLVFAKVQELIEKGQKEGDFNSYSSTELTICVLSTLKGIAFNRLHIGYKRFVCPKSEIIMKMLYL